MSFLRSISMYIATLGFLILLDSIWIGFFMLDIYKSNISKILSIPKNAVPFNPFMGMLVWMLMAFGVMFFVLPITKNLDFLTTFFYGAGFGLVLYGVFEFTNMATFSNWSLKVVIMDIVWGMLLNGAVAVFLKFIQRYF